MKSVPSLLFKIEEKSIINYIPQIYIGSSSPKIYHMVENMSNEVYILWLDSKLCFTFLKSSQIHYGIWKRKNRFFFFLESVMYNVYHDIINISNI